MDSFSTTVTSDFKWPFPKPIVGKPCEPPSPNPAPRARTAPVAPYCHCDAHSYSPRIEQYKQLLDKEEKLCQDYEQLRKQLLKYGKKESILLMEKEANDQAAPLIVSDQPPMNSRKTGELTRVLPASKDHALHAGGPGSEFQGMVSVTNDILDHPCDDLDSKMQTMYQATFKKRSFPVAEYRAVMAATQSSAPIPTESHRLGILRCYKDPTHFSEPPPTVRPTIHPPRPVHTGVVPKTMRIWFGEFPGRTEYMDAYSSTAKASWRSMQRYKEPLPSTRRRAEDTCV